jgi:transcriptional regulator with XRE-family HTH domain
MPSKTTGRRRPAGGPKASAGFPGQLREIILARRLSAHAVAASAGVAPSMVSRFLARERGLTLETFDAIAGALRLRLVESGRGRGRSAGPIKTGLNSAPDLDEPGPPIELNRTEKGPFPPTGPAPDGTDADPPSGESGRTETHRYPEIPVIHQGPDALHFLARDSDSPDVRSAPDGTTIAVAGDDATPSDAGHGAASSPGEDEARSTPGESGTRDEGAKRPAGDVVECQADAIGQARMDDDGAPPLAGG